jgi:type IV pilus assembly protein PilE
MIVIVIMGILMAISLPMYRDYVLRSHRVDAHGALLNIASLQERFAAQNNSYTTDIVSEAGLNMGTNRSPDDYYGIIATACSEARPIENCFVLTAYALGNQANDTRCRRITYDSDGDKSGSTADCW